jgi:PAS domain S-box-containing protein
LQSKLGLRERLMVLVVAAILPLAGLSVWSAVRGIDASVDTARTQLQFAASVVVASQDQAVEAARQLLAAAAVSTQLRGADGSGCNRYFEELRQRYPSYSNIGLLTPDAGVLCHANWRTRPNVAGDMVFFRRVLAERRFLMGEPVVGRAAGGPVLPFAEAVQDAQGRVTGVVFAALDLKTVAENFGRLALPDGARVIVTDTQGKVIVEYPARSGMQPGRLLANDKVLNMVRSQRPATGVALDVEGRERVFAVAPGHGPAGARSVALVSLPRDTIVGAARARLREDLAVMAAMLVAGLAMAWWFGGRSIIKPAKQILGTVRRLELGNLEARVPMPQQATLRGEFARIAAAFNLMADSLQVRQQDLRAELKRSHEAYEVLDTVINSMQEGLAVVDRKGTVLMTNRAAERVLPEGSMSSHPQEWPDTMGLYHADGRTPVTPEDLPAARALRGDTGVMRLLIRNPRVPQGRLMLCTYRPMDRGADGEPERALVVMTDITELQRAESDLVLLRNAVARINDIVMIAETGTPDSRIVFVNEAFERLTGYSAQEAIGRSGSILLGPDSDPDARAHIRGALAAGEPVREELLHYTKDGKAFWAELDIVPMADGQGRPRYFIVVERDISARKQHERALEQFTVMLQRMAEAAQRITQQHELDALLETVAEESRAVLGATEAVITLQEPGGMRRATSRAPGSGDAPVQGAMLSVPLRDGAGSSVGWLALGGKVEGSFGPRDEYVAIELAQLASAALDNVRLFRQIQELNAGLEARIAERTAELSRQREMYRALAEQAPEVVWNVDTEGRVTYFNRAWYELVGGEPPQWYGFGWLSRVHPDDRAPVSTLWERSRRTLQPYSGTRRVLGRDGEWHAMAFRAAPVVDADGKVVSWVGIDSDVTELKAIEAALRSSNQELEAFSYSVSHDLRAPLGAIGGFSRALAQRLGGQTDEKNLHYLQRIEAGVARMEQLIEALLGLARVTRAPLNRAEVDVTAMAREVLDALHAYAPGRQVTTVVQQGLVAQADPALLRIVLENLLGNAWKFTAHGEDARIEVGRDGPDGAWFVRDNGVGFDMDYAGKLFVAFQRLHTENEFPGTGIGLATVRRILTRHQGQVWAESQPGVATTFWFTLGEGGVARPPASAAA